MQITLMETHVIQPEPLLTPINPCNKQENKLVVLTLETNYTQTKKTNKKKKEIITESQNKVLNLGIAEIYLLHFT